VTVYFKIKSAGKTREQSIKDEIRSQIDEVKKHNDMSMQKLNGMLTYLIHSFGRPAWLKVARVGPNGDVEFRMLEVNSDYASTYGIERQDYIGKTDLEAGWPFHVAQQFRQHDLAVWASGEPMTIEEDVGGVKVRYRKLRVQSPDGQMKGIFGYCVDCEPDLCPLNRKRLPN
jgi:hypothetical protein